MGKLSKVEMTSMANQLSVVLICDDDATFHLAVKHCLKGRFECKSAYNSDEALAIIRNTPIDILLLDIQMRSADEGLRYLPRFKEADSDLAIVMSSGMTDFQTVREAMRLGALDYVPKDFDPNDLHHTLAQVLERRALLRRREQQNFEALSTQRQHVLIGESPAIQQLRKTIERIRNNPANVVITGETGTGKEVVARQLRKTLPDGSLAPFVAVDSSTIQSSTAESLLFGHEKGAFTGAEKATKGIFEEANGGTVYFDEIANMPLEIQAKLLRVIQEKEVIRLGSSKVLKLEFRVICATNKDLEQMVSAGQFKDDLLQRLNVLPLFIPPLRERREEIELLVRHFAEKHAGQQAPLGFTPEAIEVLKQYSWPGNIRELSNLVAYLVAMTDETEVDVADLPPRIRDAAQSAAKTQGPAPRASGTTASRDTSFYERVSAFEENILSQEYQAHAGNVSRMALSLGMDRSHLYTKLREHGIHAGKSGR